MVLGNTLSLVSRASMKEPCQVLELLREWGSKGFYCSKIANPVGASVALMGAKGASVASFELLDQYVLSHISLGQVRVFSSRGHEEATGQGTETKG